MIKISCTYFPKVTRVQISEYPKYFQFVELANTFYRFISKDELTKLNKLSSKSSDFEFVIKMNRFITHKYQFLYSNLREEALETFEKIRNLMQNLKSNKLLMETHYFQEFNDTFFKNFNDFFNSVKLNDVNLFWEFRGFNWRDKNVLPKLIETLNTFNIGHSIDISFSDPINYNKEGIIYTRMHGFGEQLDQYLFKKTDLLDIVKKANKLLEKNHEIYVVFANDEMYNDARHLQKILEEIKDKNINLDNYKLSFDTNFKLKYVSSGQSLKITYDPMFALRPEKDSIKVSSTIIKNMGKKVQDYIQVLNNVRKSKNIDEKLKVKYFDGLRKLGEYLLKYLMGSKINYRNRLVTDQNVIIQNDFKNIKFPFELIFNNRQFICLKDYLIRKFVEENSIYPENISTINKGKNISILFIYRTKDNEIKNKIKKLNNNKCNISILSEGGHSEIDQILDKDYDIVVYLGNFKKFAEEIPEIKLKWGRSEILLSNIYKSAKSFPRLFIMGNIIQNQKIEYLEHSFYNAIPILKSNCNFLTNFITLSKEDFLEFILLFQKLLLKGEPISKALNLTRKQIFEYNWGMKYSWFSFSLFGDEKSKIGGQ
ncbi:MAG: DUF72 domain-containing protein [Candidatus Helarchaeota archaeon]